MDHHVLRALQRRAVEADVGGRALRTDPHAVRLRELVVVVGADRQPLHAGRDLMAVCPLGRVQHLQERAGAVEFAAGAVVRIGPHAVVRCAAQDGVRHGGRAATVLDVVAHRIAAARVGDEHHAGSPGGAQHPVDLGGEELHVLERAAAALLWLGIVVTRQRVGHVDRVQARARPAVRLEAPQRSEPQAGGVAVAVHEDDGRRAGQWRARGAGSTASEYLGKHRGRCGGEQQVAAGQVGRHRGSFRQG